MGSENSAAGPTSVTVPGQTLDAEGYDPKRIWTTLLTNRAYFAGLLVLHHSLRRHGSRYRLRVMVPRELQRDDPEYMRAFDAAGIPVIPVDKIEPAPRDGVVNRGTWEKLAPWGFTEYEVCSPRVHRPFPRFSPCAFSRKAFGGWCRG